MIKRRLAVFLAAAMVFTAAAPSAAFADEVQDTAGIISESNISEETAGTETGENNISAAESSQTEISNEEVITENTGSTDSSDESAQEDTSPQDDGAEQETGTDAEEKAAVPEVTAVLSADEKTITVTASGLDSSASAVVFPVWSLSDGQDDLEWAQASKQEDGTWKATVSCGKHKGTGTYAVHCYQTVDGNMTFVEKTEVTLSAPTADLQIEDLDAEKGTFTVRVSNLNVPSGIAKIDLPTWGNENGQNDLVWYQPEKDGDDYIVHVNAADHAYENGIYNVHCYITDGNGNQSFVQQTTAEFAMKNGLSAELSTDETVIRVVARGIDSNASKVVFPVWSETNGQDDLQWVSASKSGAGVWSADVSVKGHKNTGLYNIHCYQTVNGTQTFFEKTTVTVTALSGTVEATAPDEETGAFVASVSNLIVPAGAKKVEFAVWGAADGQNDLVWHAATRQGDKYVASIAPGEHKFETGTYLVHCYITDNNGMFAFVGSTQVEVNLKEGVSVVVSSDQKTVQVQYVGAKAGKSLSAAVWSDKNGQDDLIWYPLKTSGNGAVVSVPISNHRTEGYYYVHLYTSDTQCIGTTSFTIDAMTEATVSVSEINGNTGTFKVTISGISTPSGIKKVSVPVWPNGDQSKMCWYTAEKSGDDYVCTVNVENHSREFGHYDIHVYGDAENGVSGFAGCTSCELNADRYMYTEKTGTYSTRVWILNPGSDASGVTFKAWSNTNGTDDVVEYTGVLSGTNDYYADILSKNHKNGGNYTTEAYKITSDGSSLAGTVTYSMAKEGEAKNQEMYQYAQGFSSDTQYLILVNRGLHRVAIYQGSQNNWKEIKYWPCVVGAPATPTPTGTFKIKGRFDWFGDGHKCWWATQIEGYYYFHTVIYYWDDAPNKILDGTMDAAASHGCIRLDEPNARWIYTTIPRGTTVHIYN